MELLDLYNDVFVYSMLFIRVLLDFFEVSLFSIIGQQLLR